jgi:hypothetical protein
MTYSPEVRERAENLYVMEGMSFSRVARFTGVTARQIINWSHEGNWREKRLEYRCAYGEIKRNLVLLRSRLVASALETMDPKTICAVARLESAARDRKENVEFPAGPAGDEEGEKPVNTAREAVSAIQEALQSKMNAIFARPERLTPGAIKEIKTSLDLIDRLKKQYHMEKEERRGLSDETVNEIRRKILGCKEPWESGTRGFEPRSHKGNRAKGPQEQGALSESGEKETEETG